MWIWPGARGILVVTVHESSAELWGGEPGGVKQQLCRLTGQGFGKPAVLLLDCGVEKSFKI
jgi:hypothetical protein